MSLRTKFFIIVGVVFVFIVFVAVILLRDSAGDTAGQVTQTVEEQNAQEPSAERKVSSGAATSEEISAQDATPAVSDVLGVARSFAERFGSFSNETDFANVRELKPLMTPTMQSWADRFVTDARKKTSARDAYYGITTKALQARAISMDAANESGKIVVKTQRREVKGNESPRVFYQDLALTMQKTDGVWKVEKAEWK